MKKIISAVLIFTSTAAFADELCGVLQSKIVAPICSPGEVCPDFMTLVYTITPTDGASVTLSMNDLSTLQSAQSFEGQNVCVDGTMNGQSFSAISIRAQN